MYGEEEKIKKKHESKHAHRSWIIIYKGKLGDSVIYYMRIDDDNQNRIPLQKLFIVPHRVKIMLMFKYM